MVRRLLQLPVFMAMAAVLTLHGCGKSMPEAFDRGHSPHLADRDAAATTLTVRPEMLHAGNLAQDFPATNALHVPSPLENWPPGSYTLVHDPNSNVQVEALDPAKLSEALHDADPDVRRRALELWAQNPDVSPEPMAYALNDSNESIRVHAQALFATEVDLDLVAPDPDPNVRVKALNAWAQHPGELLDPATYALVDPDETVRARAQALFEEELGRR